jgi:hypothetical protein
MSKSKTQRPLESRKWVHQPPAPHLSLTLRPPLTAYDNVLYHTQYLLSCSAMLFARKVLQASEWQHGPRTRGAGARPIRKG